MNVLRSLFVSPLLAVFAIAQVPTDVAVVLEGASGNLPNYTFVDTLGRGRTTVLGQNVFLTPPPVSVAVDPTGANHFFFMSVTSFVGTWRYTVGKLGRIQSSVWGAWQRDAGSRVEVTDTQVISLRGALVESRPKAQSPVGPATLLFQQPFAVDLAVAGTKLYVATNNGGFSDVVEYDLQTTALRTVGNYSSVRCIAASPIAGELALGLSTGTIERIDVATGVVQSSFATGLGSLVAVGYTRFGTLVWADAQSLWSELAPNAPIHTSSSAIVDFGVAVHPVATSTPFGVGCGIGAAAQWDASGVPSLGNSGYTIGLRSGPIASFALLALGASRSITSAGAALPIDLAVIGAAGCPLLVDPLILLLRSTDAFGETDQPLPIPPTPALAGSEWVGQWLLPDPTVGPLGLATTAGLACAIL